MFSPCVDDDDLRSTDPCRTVFLLASISHLNQAYSGAMKRFEFVFEYLYEKVDSSTGASRDDFLNYTEASIGMTVEIKERLPTHLYWYIDMVKLYTMFFPVWKDGIAGGDFEVLRDLSEYESPRIEGIGVEQVGSLLAHLIDQRKVDSFAGDVVAGRMYSETASKALIACINSHIDVNPTLIMQFLDAYSYPPGLALLGQKKNAKDYNDNPCQVEHLNQTLEEVCGSPGAEEGECGDYCRMIERGASKIVEIRKLLNMAMDYAGPLVPGNPRSLLPVCKFSGKDVSSHNCWRRVATQNGYCFSSQTGTELVACNHTSCYFLPFLLIRT